MAYREVVEAVCSTLRFLGKMTIKRTVSRVTNHQDFKKTMKTVIIPFTILLLLFLYY